MQTSNAILEGIRVIDLTRLLTGPFCAMMLGDMGTDVITIERQETVDDTHHCGLPFVEDECAYFLSINRDKRSIPLNLKSDEGKQILWALIEGANPLYADQLFDHHQAPRYQLLQQLEHATVGTTNQMGFPYTTNTMPPVIRRPPPVLGQHTDEVLAELGYSDSEERVAGLKDNGVI